jgi:hypothetical protein
MSRRHSNALPVRLPPNFLRCSGSSYGAPWCQIILFHVRLNTSGLDVEKA